VDAEKQVEALLDRFYSNDTHSERFRSMLMVHFANELLGHIEGDLYAFEIFECGQNSWLDFQLCKSPTDQ
jgi:hypothetical protein